MVKKILALSFVLFSLVSLIPLVSAVDYSLNISVVGGGQANPAFGLYYANGSLIGNFNVYGAYLVEGSNLKLYPYPASYYEIDYLLVNGVTVDVEPYEMPYEFTLDSAVTIEIHFHQPLPTPTPEPTPTPTPPPVGGGSGGSLDENWVFQGTEGYWDVCEYPNFEDVTKYPNKGSASFVYSGSVGVIGDGDGLNINFTVNNLKGDRVEWFWLNGVKRFVAVLELRKGSDVAYSWLYLAHEQGVLYETARAHFGSQFWLMSNAPEFNGGLYNLRVFREGDTKAIGAFGLTDNGWESTTLTTWNIGGSENFTVSADFWDNPTVTLYVYQEGVGAVDVVFGGAWVGEMGFVYSQGESNSPDWLKTLNSFIDFFGRVASVAFRTVVAALPVLEVFLVFWLLDALLASIHQGSVQPVGYAFMTIWDVLMRIWDVVVSFFQAVADIIPF